MAFNQVKIKGKCVVDNIHLQNQKLTKEQMKDIDTTEEQPWIYNSIFIANFNDNLYTGNNTGWRLKRKRVTDTLFTTVKDFDFNTFSYIDHQVANRTDYIYAIHSLAAGGEGLGVEGNVRTDSYGWFLFDENNSYKFDAGYKGLESGNIQVVEDVHIFNNYTKYPVFSYSPRKYKQSDLTTLPYKIVGDEMQISVSLLHEIEAFINNQKPKWLKNTAGELFLVNTSNFSYKYNDSLYEQPFTISFTWTQIGDAV